jgi:uncharacterized membrane protein YgaE (UPF0421/DUF939 family)
MLLKGVNFMRLELKRIGARNIKTAIAVVLSILISKLFKMEYPFYAAIASIISMQSSVINSISAGKSRMLGTMIGALVGFLCALIDPGNLILVGAGIIIVIYLCNLLNWKDSASIACVVFCVIMLNLKESDPFLYSINRIIDTFVGIMVAVAVNYFIIPPRKQEEDESLENS